MRAYLEVRPDAADDELRDLFRAALGGPPDG